MTSYRYQRELGLSVYQIGTLQAKLKTMENDWWTGLAERTQRYADMGDMRAFYEALKAVCGPSHQIQAPLHSSHGSTLLTDKEAILQR